MQALSLNYSDIYADTEQTEFEFLLTCLNLGRTFVRITQDHRAVGRSDLAQQTLARAYRSYANIARLLPYLQEARHKEDISLELRNFLPFYVATHLKSWKCEWLFERLRVSQDR
jgi:hypothetical protein